MFLRDDARLSQAYRYIVCIGANSWLQKVASAQQIAESLDDVFSLSSFRNAQLNQWMSLKVQVQPVLRCVLACGRFLRFRQGKKQPACRLLPVSACLQGRNSEQINEASLRCTCYPVASSPNKGVSLLVRWLKAKKARTSGCVRQENDMHLTMKMWTSGHPRPCVDGYITWNRSHEEKGEPAKLMEANGRVAPTPFSRCQANYLCERQLNQLWEYVFFAGAFVATQQRAAITPANQLDATLFLNQNMAHLLTWTTHVSPSSRRW